MRSTDEIIRQQIDSCGPRQRGRRFTPELRKRITAHARAEIENRRSRLSIAKAIGIPDQTLTRWMQAAAFVQVEVEDRVPAGTIVLTSPDGWRIEGLKLEQVAELLRRTP